MLFRAFLRLTCGTCAVLMLGGKFAWHPSASFRLGTSLLKHLPLVLPPPVLLQTTLLERRMFYVPSFKIYGAVAGFYDYGPPGCSIKQNMTQVRPAITFA